MSILRRITAGLPGVPAVLLACGCTAGGMDIPEDSPDHGPMYEGEAQCGDTAQDSPTDKACQKDCIRPCGFNGSPHYPRADKFCECQGGVYIECRCPRPDWYKGAVFAPYCDSLTPDGSGYASLVGDMACEHEWDQCVGRDPVDGYTPRGAVCMNKRGTDEAPELIWVDASTEKWFAPEQ